MPRKRKLKTPTIPVETRGLNDQIMALSAHRYCMGRSTYVSGACVDWILQNWHWFEENTRFVMVRDTITALMDGEAGHPEIDEPGWKRLLKWMWGRLSEDHKVLAWRQTSHKHKPWPIEDMRPMRTETWCMECDQPIHLCLCSHEDNGKKEENGSATGNTE